MEENGGADSGEGTCDEMGELSAHDDDKGLGSQLGEVGGRVCAHRCRSAS